LNLFCSTYVLWWLKMSTYGIVIWKHAQMAIEGLHSNRLKLPFTICTYEHQTNMWVFWFHLIYEFKDFVYKLVNDEPNHILVLWQI
jgi:hypothetical protein